MNVKEKLYFPIARYFRFWAKIALRRWDPYVIVVTGSSGKTTMLNLIDSQIGNQSKVSHHANSAYGVPFNILDLDKLTSQQGKIGWIKAVFLSPIKAFTVKYDKKYYVAEADADRPMEGQFLANLLQPDITIWISSSRTHAMRYDKLSRLTGTEVEVLIAEEYANLAHAAKDAVIADADNPYIFEQLTGIGNKLHAVSDLDIKDFKIGYNSCEFELNNGSIYKLHGLVPPIAGKQIVFLDMLMSHLNIGVDNIFSKLVLPPGRSTLLKGIKGSLVIDSSYNSNLSSASAVLDMFKLYPHEPKILVIGDMYEQGKNEGIEHTKLAEKIINVGINYKLVVLYGRRAQKYIAPKLKEAGINVTSFLKAKDAAHFLHVKVEKDDVLLVKGGGMLEGLVEKLVEPSEVDKLARRGEHWDRLRKLAGY